MSFREAVAVIADMVKGSCRETCLLMKFGG